MINWDDIRYFLAVARKGSITAAARDLGVNHSTVSRRISAFEESMGVRLFDRVASGYVLTQAGHEMVASAQRMEDEAQSLDRKLYGRDTELTGVLKVASAASMINGFFMSQIGQFLVDYPGIEIEMHISNELANLHAREVDVAIRGTNNPPETLVGRRLGRMTAMLYGPEDFIAPGEPGAPNSATAPDVLAYTVPELDFTRAGWFADVYPHAKVRLRLNSPEAMLEGVRAGIGIAMVPCHMGDITPGVRRLPPYHSEGFTDLWLLTHSDLRKTAKVRAFMNFMADAIMPHRDLIEGRRPPQFSSGGSIKLASSYQTGAE